MDIEEQFIYALRSKKRTRVLMFLASAGPAFNSEIADMLLFSPHVVTSATKQLLDYGLLDYDKCGNTRLYKVTARGREVYKLMRDHFGLDK